MRNNAGPVAFVLGMDANGLGAARSLGREGIPVVGVDYRPSTPGLSSRYCKPLLTPDPTRQAESTLGVLVEAGRKFSTRGVLFPTSDAYVLFVSRFREVLSRYFLFAIPSQQILECSVNKRKLYDLAETIGIPYPKTLYPQSIDKLSTIIDEIDFPAFIKPYYSHVWYETFKTKGFKVRNPDELVAAFRRIFNANLQAMIQSIIPGPNTNHAKVCAYLSEEHNPLAIFVTKKLRQYPTEFGIGTFMESIHNEALVGIGLKLFREFHYRGIGSIEFKKDDRDGVYKMIELNPRLWLQNIQAAHAGINFPLIQYRELAYEQIEKAGDFEDGVTWLDIIQDFAAFCDFKRRGLLTLPSWLGSLKNVDCHAYFARDDMKPFMSESSSRSAKIAENILHILRSS